MRLRFPLAPLVAVSLFARETPAQQCSHDCTANLRDPHGCCPATETGAATHAQHSAVVPTFDVGGVWHMRDLPSMVFFQEGAEVWMMWSAGDYRARFEGTYSTPTTIRGRERRRTPTGCLMWEDVVLTVASPTSMNFHYQAPAAATCDYGAGAHGDDPVTR